MVNTQTYKVNDSHNRNEVYGFLKSYMAFEATLYTGNSKQSFDPGGTRFSHNVGNIDINRILSDKVSIGMGAEFRNETLK